MKRALAGTAAAWAAASLAMAQTNAPDTTAQQAAVAPPPATQKNWTDGITVRGDIRYRYETIQVDLQRNANQDTHTRQRDQIQARLGADARCSAKLKAGLELLTGGANPTSGNQTLGDGFRKDEIRWNLAYLDYSLLDDATNAVHGIAGKMKNPFITFPDDLVWDSDVTPEGLAIRSQIGGGLATLLVNGGYLWIQERADTDDTMLYAGQAAVKFRCAPAATLTLGGSYYGYRGARGFDVIAWEDKSNAYGNSTVNGTVNGGVTNKVWASEFTLVLGFARFDASVAGLPLAIFAQGLRNTDADDFDDGHMYGVTLGKATNAKTWEVGYSYAELDKDAALGIFTDASRWGGGTDGKGHKFSGKYQVAKNLQLGVTYYLDEKWISDAAKTSDYNRFNVDLLASF